MAILVFIFILSVLVFVHELGHFLAAKRAGILVEEFGFGLMPGMRILSKKVGETIYSWNWLPIGGFVKLYGEDSEVQSNEKRAFYKKTILQRTMVLLGGVVMNLVLAVVAFAILYNIYGVPVKTGRVKVLAMAENSPARLAEFKVDDRIVTLDGTRISNVNQFVKLANEKAGQKIEIEVDREKDNPCRSQVLGGMAPEVKIFNCRGDNLVLFVIPRLRPPEGEGPLGIAIADTELKKLVWYQMVPLGIKEGFKESWAWGKMIVDSLGTTLSALIKEGKVPRNLAGPIGIFQITGEATKSGPLAVLQFLGILSVNLAVINLLPLPSTDGGRLIFIVYEIFARKKANPKVEATVNAVGFALLLALMLLITVNDILRLIGR